jgi:hypothetical protein
MAREVVVNVALALPWIILLIEALLRIAALAGLGWWAFPLINGLAVLMALLIARRQRQALVQSRAMGLASLITAYALAVVLVAARFSGRLPTIDL